MYHKGIVMEIKKDYCLVLEDSGNIVRLGIKEGLEVGQKIFYFDEDIYKKEIKPASSWIYSRKFKNVMISCLAVMIMVFSFISFRPVPAYATVSFNGDKSLQVVIDKDFNIKEAHSYDESFSEKNLKSLNQLDDIEKYFSKDSLILVGFALNKEDIKGTKSLETYIQKVFKNKNIKLYSGTADDVEQAEKNNQNLGIYIINQYDHKDIEEFLEDDMDMDDMEELLEDYPELSSNENLMDEIEDKDDDDFDDDDFDDDFDDDDD